MTDFKLRESMYHLKCLRRASDHLCIPSSRTEGFAPLQFKTLNTTVPVTAQAQVVFRPQTRTQCHSHVWRDMSAIFPHVFSPAPRTQCQNMGNMIMTPMQLLRSPKKTEEDRIGVKKIEGQLECDYGEGDSLFSWFLWSEIFPVESYLNILCVG